MAEPLPAAHRALAGSSRRGRNAHGCSEPAVPLVGSVHGSRLLRTVEVELAGLVECSAQTQQSTVVFQAKPSAWL